MILALVYSISWNVYVRVSKYFLSMSKSFDVIVIGSDPEGIAAAISSARNGLRTLLIDDRSRLGGLWTIGGLNFIDMNYDPRGRSVVDGLFSEFINEIGDIDPHYPLFDSFDPDDAELAFQRMIDREPHLITRLNAKIVSPTMNGDIITGLAVKDKGKCILLRAKRVIDATQDADIAAQAGVPYYFGMEDFNLLNEYQPMTLVFELDNVNWHDLRSMLLCKKFRHENGVNGTSAWGCLNIMRGYKPLHKCICLRGLNIGRLKNDRVLINAMQIVGVNPLDKAAKRRAMLEAREELVPLTKYIVSHIQGFEKAKLVGGMPELYVRESRHVVGQYRLNVNDIVENRDFPDKIACGSYPMDVQRTSLLNNGYVLGEPQTYTIPFRCLVPKYVENLLVVGRCASYDSLAHSSARTVPIGIATGQAAGVACKYSIRDSMPFHGMSDKPEIEHIQQTLREQGAYLPDLHYGIPYKTHWALKSIRFLRGLGVLVTGYDNDYRLDDPVPSLRVINMSLKSEERCFIYRKGIPPDIVKSHAVNPDQAARLILYLAGQNHWSPNRMGRAVKLRIIQPSTAARVLSMPKFNNAAWFTMLKDYIHYEKGHSQRIAPTGPHIDRTWSLE